VFDFPILASNLAANAVDIEIEIMTFKSRTLNFKVILTTSKPNITI